MAGYNTLSKEQLNEELVKLKEEYAKILESDISLDMSRGKPGEDQLNLSMGMMNVLDGNSDYKTTVGFDCRNYGLLDGIPEAKQMMADIMEVSPENVIVFGNASLNIMYDTVSRSFTHGVRRCRRSDPCRCCSRNGRSRGRGRSSCPSGRSDGRGGPSTR